MANRRRALDAMSIVSEVLCESCFTGATIGSSESVRSTLLWPIVVPSDLSNTHLVCPYCRSLQLAALDHTRHCVMWQDNLTLTVGGWESPQSSAIKRDLRRANPILLPLVSVILREILSERDDVKDAIFVPVPVLKPNRRDDNLSKALRHACESLGAECVPVLSREKRRSTRGSVAQIRTQIATSEYYLEQHHSDMLTDRTVVLVDDTVTTGSTFSGVAKLLRSHGAVVNETVAIDRTISPRLQQYLANNAALGCTHKRTSA